MLGDRPRYLFDSRPVMTVLKDGSIVRTTIFRICRSSPTVPLEGAQRVLHLFSGNPGAAGIGRPHSTIQRGQTMWFRGMW